MDSLQTNEVKFNLESLKRFGFYQLFDPKSPKVFNYNVYRFIYIAYLVTVLCVNVLTAITLFMEDNSDSRASIMLLAFVYISCVNSMINVCILLYKAETIWSLFDATRLDFLKSRACCKHISTVYKYQEKSTRITDNIFRSITAVYFLWMFFPLALNMFSTTESQNEKYENIFNMNFPVSTSVYNQYYSVFYFIEIAVETFLYSTTTMNNIFLITFYLAIIAQYEVLAQAYEDIGHEEKENDVIEEVKQILYDHSNVYMKLKSLYSIIWIIIVTHVVLISSTIIALIYSLIVVCMSVDSIYILIIFKLIMAILVFGLDLFLCCFLCELMNEKVDAVNFALYSCNWTEMDLKFKKLILLAMRINNANQLNIRLSPTKLINLQLLASVIKISFNVINVMLNTLNKKNKIKM